MRSMSFVSRMLLLCILILCCLLFFTLIGYGLAVLVFEVSLTDLNSFTTPSAVNGLKLVQALTAIGGYLLSAILFLLIIKSPPIQYLKLNRKVSFIGITLLSLIIVSSFPLNGLINQWNMSIPMPEIISNLEAGIETTVNQFLKMPTFTDFLINILVIAIIAAVAEEVLFRGVIQQAIQEKTANYHLAIWTTAIVFSAIHMQFSGFFPRMLLGAMFGYLFYWTQSIWYPIIAHFLNNGITVLAVYIYGVEAMEEDFLTKTEVLYVGFSTIVFVVLIRIFYLYSRDKAAKIKLE